MDKSRKYYPEWSNPIWKEDTWNAKLLNTQIELTDHIKLREKEDQSVGASILLRKGNKILKGENWGSKCRAEIEGKVIQRLPYLGIHPVYSHQTQTLWWMPSSACWKEADIVISWGARQSLTNTEADTSSQLLEWAPNGGLRERTEGAEGVCNPIGWTSISTNQISPEFPGTKPPTKEYTRRDPWPQLHM